MTGAGNDSASLILPHRRWSVNLNSRGGTSALVDSRGGADYNRPSAIRPRGAAQARFDCRRIGADLFLRRPERADVRILFRYAVVFMIGGWVPCGVPDDE